jgi:hypothetical protein
MLLYGPEWASHEAGPASHALFLVVDNPAAFFILAQSAGYAGLNAVGIVTMPAVKGSGDPAFLINGIAGQKALWLLVINGQNQILAPGMLQLTGQLAKPASDAYFRIYIYSLHKPTFQRA